MMEKMAAIRARPRLNAILAGRWGPLALAVALAVASVPLVTVSLLLPPQDWVVSELGDRWTPASVWDALVLAGSSVLTAAVVGGGVAGLLVRRWPVVASLVAMAIAWPTAISMLSITASLTGVHPTIAIFCFDTCTPQITAAPASGIMAYASLTFLGLVTALPALLALAFLLGALVLVRRRRSQAGSVFAVLAYSALNAWAALFGGLIAIACLGIGVVLWTTVLKSSPSTSAAHASQPVAATTG